MSTLNIHLPGCLWVLIIGVVISFLLGYFQTERVVCRTRDGRTKVVSHQRYAVDFPLCASACFGLAFVITFLRYSMTIPELWLWRLVLYALAIGGIVVMTLIFWAVAEVAMILSHDNKK